MNIHDTKKAKCPRCKKSCFLAVYIKKLDNYFKGLNHVVLCLIQCDGCNYRYGFGSRIKV